MAEAQADFSRVYRLDVSFTDVEFATASILKTASILNMKGSLCLDISECARLKPLLRFEPISITSTTAQPMLASTVIYAKRSANAQIQADIIKRLGRVLNVAGDAKVVLGEENIVELTSEKRVAVAYAPAYTIRDAGQADASVVVVAPYDRENPDSREALLNLAAEYQWELGRPREWAEIPGR